MSNTYSRDRQRKAFKHLAEGSASLMDFRSRLIYVSLSQKHPRWPASLVYAIAETRAFFVTLFQKPLEKRKTRQMARRLRKASGKH